MISYCWAFWRKESFWICCILSCILSCILTRGIEASFTLSVANLFLPLQTGVLLAPASKLDQQPSTSTTRCYVCLFTHFPENKSLCSEAIEVFCLFAVEYLVAEAGATHIQNLNETIFSIYHLNPVMAASTSGAARSMTASKADHSIGVPSVSIVSCLKMPSFASTLAKVNAG